MDQAASSAASTVELGTGALSGTLADAAAVHRAGILESAAAIMDLTGGQLCAVDVIRPADVPLVQHQAQAGDQRAVTILAIANEVAAQVQGMSGKPSCLGCDRPAFERSYAVAMVSAGFPGSPYVAGPVCCDCAQEPDAVLNVALPAFREVWPGLRILPPIHPEAGHA